MEQSQFIQWITRWFGAIVLGITTTINGTKDNPTEYFHKRMLTKKFSVSGKWETLLGTYTRIRADFVAINSTLPLKKRDSFGKASGDIPKSGMEFQLNEQQLQDIDTMVAIQVDEPTIVAQIFQDAKRALESIAELNESVFLEGISTGVCVIDDIENVGTGVRVDYGYPSENKFGAAGVVWANTSAKPLDDLQRMVDKAKTKGNKIIRLMMDSTAFNNMVKTTQLKEEFAFFIGYTGDILRSPSLSKANEILSDKFGFTIELVDVSTIYERDGNQTTYKPWADGAVVGITQEIVGAIVYAKLAEENHPVSGVAYQKADDFILLSMFRNNRPLAEHTTVQARVVPIVSTPVYLLDTKTVQA